MVVLFSKNLAHCQKSIWKVNNLCSDTEERFAYQCLSLRCSAARIVFFWLWDSSCNYVNENTWMEFSYFYCIWILFQSAFTRKWVFFSKWLKEQISIVVLTYLVKKNYDQIPRDAINIEGWKYLKYQCTRFYLLLRKKPLVSVHWVWPTLFRSELKRNHNGVNQI